MNKKNIIFLFSFFLFSAISNCNCASKKNSNLIIRVLLEETSAISKKKISILSSSGIYFESPMGSKQRYKTKRNVLNVIVKNSNLYFQCKDGFYRKVKHNDLALSPITGMLHIEDKSYKGTLDLRINKRKKTLQLINKLPLNDYIYSVLRYESLSFWPLEMQKVQAVASRSYALYQMKLRRQQNKKVKLPYDIKNTNFHQVYNGDHKFTHLKQAVYSTHNEVLTHQDDIALTMFDICCGGVIPHHMKDTQKEKDKPYLFRKNKCIYCKTKKNFSWQQEFKTNHFFSSLKKHRRTSHKLKKIKRMVGIRVQEKDKAGLVHKIEIAGRRKSSTLSIHDLKASLPSNLKSTVFDLKMQGNRIIMSGMGFGHNLGLCQLGARELVARGWNYKKILRFYYPETELRRLKH